jgi:hypothetical protein
MTYHYTIVKQCIVCSSPQLTTIFKMDRLPIADQLNQNPHDPIIEIPITLVRCNSCHLLFIKELVDPKHLFPRNYPYFTGVSEDLRCHFSNLATTVIDAFKLDETSFVIDIGSNDGTLLSYFIKKNIGALGVDPTTRPVVKALLKHIPTLQEFWDVEVSKILAEELKRKVDVVFCNNVISHVSNPLEFIKALEIIGDADTKYICEFPYLLSVVQNTAFDIIFHQHVSYFTLNSFAALINRFGFFINDSEILSIHGGNIRITFSRNQSQSAHYIELLKRERLSNVESEISLLCFVRNIEVLKNKTNSLINKLLCEGKKIMGYGAAGKATMLVKYFELDKSKIKGIIDKNIYKQGKFFPAYNHSILPIDILWGEEKPDYLIILAWTLKSEIIRELKLFQESGGKYIVILPDLEII